MSALVFGALIGAISPAIVIPGVLELLGKKSSQHQRALTGLLIGAPIDNILALVAMGLAIEFALLSTAPSWEILGGFAFNFSVGIVVGIIAGWLLSIIVKKRLRQPGALVISAWLLAGVLIEVGQAFNFSFVLAIITMGIVLRQQAQTEALKLSEEFKKVWKMAQYALFGLVGAAIPLVLVKESGALIVLIVIGGQIGRLLFSFLATSRSGLTSKERLAAALAYIPKATIQAAFGAWALDRGLAEGQLILVAAVVAVALTAPIGAITLSKGADPLLEDENAKALDQAPQKAL